MTVGKAGLLTAALVAVFALGVITGPTIRDTWSKVDTRETSAVAPAVEPGTPAPATAERPAARPKPSPSRVSEPITAKKPDNAIQSIAVSMWEPEVRDRVKAVLNRGSRLEIAAEDFNSSEQFVTVAHAARNTNVPFMVLKDRVVNKGQSLSQAIRESKPELDAKAEVARATAEARSDLGITG